MTAPYQYYPTPEALSRKAWAMFKNQQFTRVLEPSAGEGHLLRSVPYQYGKRLPIDCIEIDIRKHAVLRDEGFAVVRMDFLQFQSGGVYSHIINDIPKGKSLADHKFIEATHVSW